MSMADDLAAQYPDFVSSSPDDGTLYDDEGYPYYLADDGQYYYYDDIGSSASAEEPGGSQAPAFTPGWSWEDYGWSAVGSLEETGTFVWNGLQYVLPIIGSFV